MPFRYTRRGGDQLDPSILNESTYERVMPAKVLLIDLGTSAALEHLPSLADRLRPF